MGGRGSESFHRTVWLLLLGGGGVHHAGLAARGGGAGVGLVDGFAEEFPLQHVAAGEVVDAVGVHESGVSPVGACRRGAAGNGEDVPHGHVVCLAEVDNAAGHVGCVLVGHFGGGVVCAPAASPARGVAACALGNVAAGGRGEEEADAGATLADAVGERLHGLGMHPLVDGVAVCLVGPEGDDDEVGVLGEDAVDHVGFVEPACPCSVDAIVGELHPGEVLLERGAHGARQDVALDVGVANVHHFHGALLLDFPEEGRERRSVDEFVVARVPETGGEGGAQGLRVGVARADGADEEAKGERDDGCEFFIHWVGG